ncbi:DUF3717 domain-containing protein [Paraburkholderia dioscoreae]|uniref:DUF3717 domain-containing protein n=1 Tax=Paraburkholderia dioscoreae TaxID=2604047 RepID=A0A5Q4Z2R6_9BURK|nr:DUF3717 domain-containing protein [Paraburkholderia dioscoreae]VVD30984.1 conserved protein of unknown function [Paraburkholderia dioscoreae]
MPQVAIEQIERAINIWRARCPAPEGGNECPILCAEARALADVYALMIIGRKSEIDASTFTPKQAAAFTAALGNHKA